MQVTDTMNLQKDVLEPKAPRREKTEPPFFQKVRKGTDANSGARIKLVSP